LHGDLKAALANGIRSDRADAAEASLFQDDGRHFFWKHGDKVADRARAGKSNQVDLSFFEEAAQLLGFVGLWTNGSVNGDFIDLSAQRAKFVRQDCACYSSAGQQNALTFDVTQNRWQGFGTILFRNRLDAQIQSFHCPCGLRADGSDPRVAQAANV
jgi:hypothetical protein